MPNWKNLLRHEEAVLQIARERARSVARAYAAGASWGEIARKLKITPARARQIGINGARWQASKFPSAPKPLDLYDKNVDFGWKKLTRNNARYLIVVCESLLTGPTKRDWLDVASRSGRARPKDWPPSPLIN